MKTEEFAVDFGDKAGDLKTEAEKSGITPAGQFIIDALEGLRVQGAAFEGIVSTAHDVLVGLADHIDRHGIKPGDEKHISATLRYAAQFASLRAIPIS